MHGAKVEQIGAHIGDRRHLERQKLRLRVERQLDMGDVVAAVRVGHKAFRALGGPFDRPPDFAGGPGDDRLLGVMVDLRAEAAADIGGDDAQFRLGDVEDERAHQQADHMRVLARRKKRVVAGGAVEFADRGARLHRVRNETVVDEVELDDARGLGEGGIDRGEVAEAPVVTEIARHIGKDLRCPRLQRLAGVDDRRLLDILDLDLVGRLARLIEGLGDDDGDRVADVAHVVGRERRVRRLGHRRAVFRMNLPTAGQPADAIRRHVLAGEDSGDAGGLRRGGGVDAGYPRMCIGAAQDVGVELVRAVDVVGVGALSGQKAVILAPPDRRSDRGHRLTPPPPHGRWPAASRHA